MGQQATLYCSLLLLLVVSQFSSAQDNSDSYFRRPPSITKGPETVILAGNKNIIVRENNNVPLILHCEATGSPLPTYEWYHNGQSLNMNQNSIKQPDLTKGTIEIRKAREENAGNYQCIAHNQHGKALSQIVDVKLATMDDAEQQDLSTYRKNEGEGLIMYCVSGKTYPPPKYSWYTTNQINNPLVQPVSLDSRVSIDEEGNLHFAHLLTSDQQITADAPDGKIYKCSIYNSYTEVSQFTSPSKIVVNPLPSVKDRKPVNKHATQKFTALAGDTINLKCLFTGKPEPKVNWEKRPNAAMPPHSKSFNDLEIENIKESDSGIYRCTGTNQAGSDYKDIEVNVESVPVFKRKPEASNTTEGEAATFICTAEGTPPASISWYLNGDKIDTTNPPARVTITAGDTNLTIVKTCKDCPVGSSRVTDLMNVQCNASNVHGSAFTDAYLNIILPTVLTVAPQEKMLMVFYEEVIIPCEATSDDSTPVDIRWYKDDVRVDYIQDRVTKTEDGHLHIITKDDKDGGKSHAGMYTCEATNGYSKVTSTSELYWEGPVPPPMEVAGASIEWWWFIIVIVILLLLLILLLCCCLCCQRNRGEAYPIDEKEKKQGLDPEKELADSGFQDYQRPEDEPMKGSRASLTSTIKLDSDEEGSLNEYADIDAGKFNEDGSFIGQYSEKKKGRRGDTMV